MDLLHKLKLKFKKPKEVLQLEVLHDKCVGCGKCVKECKREVFALLDKKAVVKDIKLCVGCGKCVDKFCRFDAIKLVVAPKNR